MVVTAYDTTKAKCLDCPDWTREGGKYAVVLEQAIDHIYEHDDAKVLIIVGSHWVRGLATEFNFVAGDGWDLAVGSG